MNNAELFEKYFEEMEHGDRDYVDPDFLDDPRRKPRRPVKSQRTIDNHREVLKPFQQWLGNRPIDAQAIRDYIKLKRTEGFVKNDVQYKYSEGSMYKIKSCIKRFVGWIDPDLAATIRLTPAKQRDIKVLTEEDVITLIEKGCKSTNNRDRALVAFLWESGCRKGEVQNIKICDIEEISDINMDDQGFRLTVDGKTGKRTLKLAMCAPYIRQWLKVHPDGDNPDAPLFTTTNDASKPFSRDGFKAQLKAAGERAGFTFRIYPHLFRHSRASHLAKKFTEAQMNNYFGWSHGSKQASTYVHLSGRDNEDAIDTLYGLKPQKTEDTIIRCPNCGTINGKEWKRCSKCNRILHEELKESTNSDATEALTKALLIAAQDPELAALFKAALFGNENK